MALNNLALTYLNLANFTKAEKYLERAVSLKPQDGVIYNNFGIAAYEQGKYDLAKSFIKKSLSLLTDEFGESDIELTAPLNSLGIVYSELDEFVESEFYYKKALDIIQKQLGEEHQYYATTFGNLANVWLSSGQFKKAFEAYFINSAPRRFDVKYLAPLLIKGKYNFFIISNALFSLDPMTILSGYLKSLIASPSLKNSGFEIIVNFFLFFKIFSI